MSLRECERPNARAPAYDEYHFKTLGSMHSRIEQQLTNHEAEMIRDEEEQEVAQWLETWTENNAIPGTMPEDESPCIDALNFKRSCILAAQEEGYTEEDLIRSEPANGDLDAYFDRAARRNFKINPGR